MMLLLRPRHTLLAFALAACGLLSSPARALCQQPAVAAPVVVAAQAQNEAEAVDLEVHLHLLVGSNTAVEGARVPASLDAALRQLRANTPLTNYRLGATFLQRVKTGRSLGVKGMGGASVSLPSLKSSDNPYTPAFYEFNMGPFEIRRGAGGRDAYSIPNFHFGMRVPVVTQLMGGGTTGAPSQPVVQYEQTGITTGLTVEEGEPVVVGTLYTGQDGEAIIVILTTKRTSPR